jgi:hypothetical protein
MDQAGKYVADAVLGIDTLWGGDVMCASGTGRFIADSWFSDEPLPDAYTHPTAARFEASRCLESIGGRRVLLVTSDYHTRRALSIFSKEAPNRYSMAAAYDPREFGVQWWRHREWSKTNLYEWMRLMWWELIELCEEESGFGTAKAVIVSGAAVVHASTLLALSQEPMARA